MKLTFVLLLTLISFNCNVLKVVPSYHPQAVAMVTAGSQNTNQLYDNMIASSDKRYITFEDSYMIIARQIHDILVLDSSRDKSKVILIIANDIKKRFSKYEFAHKSSVTLNNAELQSYKDGMNALWKSLYNSEINLKP